MSAKLRLDFVQHEFVDLSLSKVDGLMLFFLSQSPTPAASNGGWTLTEAAKWAQSVPVWLAACGTKVGGEEGRGGCMYYYFPKDKSVHSHHFSAGRTILEIRWGVDYFRPACSGLAKGHIPGLHILCVPRENSGKSRRLDANHMKRKRRLLNYV